MSRALLVLTVVMSVFGCSQKNGPEATPSAPKKENLLTKNQWCSQDKLGKTAIITRYNFSYDPEAFRSKLTQDRIMVRGKETRLYQGEAQTDWAFYKDEVSLPIDGYGVEVVSDEKNIGDMMSAEGLSQTEKAPKTALKVHPNFISLISPNKQHVHNLFPCTQFVDVSGLTPQSFAEFQIELGKVSREYSRFGADGLSFALDLTPPVREIKSDEVSKIAWCGWFPMSDEKSYQLTVKIFAPNGSYSEQDYFEPFKEYDDASNLKRYSRNVGEARHHHWKIDEKSKRVVLERNLFGNILPESYKLVEDRDGKKALFGVNSEAPDFPLAVQPYDIYHDCADPIPGKFQPSWSQWISRIADLQMKATK